MPDEIHEHDVVVLLRDLPEARISAGETGTVVHIYPNAAALEVEFRPARHTPAGGDSGVVTVEPTDILKLKSARFAS